MSNALPACGRCALVSGYSAGLSLSDRPVARPGPGEVTIRVDTVPIGFADALIASGGYQIVPDLPFVPGNSCSGTVVAAGTDVSRLRPGDGVIGGGWIGSPRSDRKLAGTLAEYVTAPQQNFRRLPPGIDLRQAALFCSNFETACHALTKAALRSGETLLVMGAAGGTGFAAVSLGKMMGARVIASASTPEKRQLAEEAGADAVIDSGAQDWRDRVRHHAGTVGVDVVFDPVGGEASERAFRCLAPEGRFLVVGFASGTVAKLPLNLTILKDASVIGVDIVQFRQRRADEAQAQAEFLLNALAEKRFRLPSVQAAFPLERFAEAFAASKMPGVAGRILVEMSR